MTSLILGIPAPFTKTDEYLLGAVKKTIENGANCFKIVTGYPVDAERPPLADLFLKQANNLAKSSNIDFSNCIVEAPYNSVNLASEDEDCSVKSFIISEIKRMVEMGIQYFVIEPGHYPLKTREGRVIETSERLKYLIENIKEILALTRELNYFLLLETMSDENNQLGVNFEEFWEIFESCRWDSRLSLCLHVANLHINGYNLSNIEALKDEIEGTVGLKRVKAIYLADARNAMGNNRDKYSDYGRSMYAKLGYGNIGFENLINIVYDPYFSTLPIIIRTPYWRSEIVTKGIPEKQIKSYFYQHEIQSIREKVWKPIPEIRYRVQKIIYDKENS